MKTPHKHADNSASTKVPHKHAELIKQWADGATIQFKPHTCLYWKEVAEPNWNDWCDYRVKAEPTPDVVRYQFVTNVNTRACIGPDARSIANLMLVFDGETGALKDAQVLTKG